MTDLRLVIDGWQGAVAFVLSNESNGAVFLAAPTPPRPSSVARLLLATSQTFESMANSGFTRCLRLQQVTRSVSSRSSRPRPFSQFRLPLNDKCVSAPNWKCLTPRPSFGRKKMAIHPPRRKRVLFFRKAKSFWLTLAHSEIYGFVICTLLCRIVCISLPIITSGALCP